MDATQRHLLAATLPRPESLSDLAFCGVLRGARAELVPAFFLSPRTTGQIEEQIAARAVCLLHLGGPMAQAWQDGSDA